MGAPRVTARHAGAARRWHIPTTQARAFSWWPPPPPPPRWWRRGWRGDRGDDGGDGFDYGALVLAVCALTLLWLTLVAGAYDSDWVWLLLAAEAAAAGVLFPGVAGTLLALALVFACALAVTLLGDRSASSFGAVAVSLCATLAALPLAGVAEVARAFRQNIVLDLICACKPREAPAATTSTKSDKDSDKDSGKKRTDHVPARSEAEFHKRWAVGGHAHSADGLFAAARRNGPRDDKSPTARALRAEASAVAARLSGEAALAACATFGVVVVGVFALKYFSDGQ